MGKMIIGTLLMVAGLFASFIPPFIWGAPLFMIGVPMMLAGFGSVSVSTAKAGVAIAKEVRSGSAGGGYASSPEPVAAPAPARPAPGGKDYDAAKWEALVEFDPDIKAAVSRIEPYGQAVLDRLARAYLAIGDKAMLEQIVAKIAVEASEGQQSR